MTGKISTNQLIGDIREMEVRLFFAKNFGWIFRPYGSDIGIDGEVEIMFEKEKDAKSQRSSGSFIKVQVKGRADGEISVNKEEAAYWLGLAAPVILVLIDGSDKAHYCEITSKFLTELLNAESNSHVFKTSDFKLLDASAKADLIKIGDRPNEMRQRLHAAEYLLNRQYSFLGELLDRAHKATEALLSYEVWTSEQRRNRDQALEWLNIFTTVDRVLMKGIPYSNVYSQRYNRVHSELRDKVQKIDMLTTGSYS